MNEKDEMATADEDLLDRPVSPPDDTGVGSARTPEPTEQEKIQAAGDDAADTAAAAADAMDETATTEGQ